ncbi:hypothetical protein Gohar_010373 [Gossypium harknessii]|uniref:DUF4283 domain-containing protein n=1 Tax=Gossypium harknessii TaxID=34285 RepID=A0A7J9GQT6_9ROSI|nr:hypothetical protein [Gossypium harknessii]
MDQIFLSVATVFERGDDLDQAAGAFEVYVQRMILEVIGGIVGNVAKLDFKMDSKTKGRFARMTVFINLDRPFVSQYGHINKLCPSVVVDLNRESRKYSVIIEPRDIEIRVRGVTKTMYRPWMMMEWKSRCGKSESRISKDKNAEKIILGSRFSAFNEVGKMEDDEGVTGEHSSSETTKEKESIPTVAKGFRAKENFKENLGNGFGTSRGLDTSFETLVGLAKSIGVCIGREANLGHVYVGLALKKMKKRLV